MSQSNQTSIYLGFWIDWTEGKYQGATWTLSQRGAALLQSFTAIFVTFVFAQLWSIVTFALHHTRSTRNPVDGLKHQRQAVLRNAGALATAVIFAKQTFYWHGKAKKAIIRSLVWTTSALCFAAAAGLASTFSGYAASKSSLNRLVIGDNCGYTTYADQDGVIDLGAYSVGTGKDTISAASYARTCYDDDSSTLGQCRRYVRPRINWTGTANTSCPFESGICSNGDQASFTLLTEPIDSQTGLGINSPTSERLSLQKRMTCSSIREINNYNQVGPVVYYNFGPVGGTLFNYTFKYNRLAEAALVSYSLASTYSYANFASPWSPVKALNRTDADVSIVFISSNSVAYYYPNDDPVFSATKLSATGYSADYDVSTLACAEQYQVCNPAVKPSNNNGAECTSWMGAAQLIFLTASLDGDLEKSNTTIIPSNVPLWKKSEARLTARQVAILQRISYVLPLTSTYNAIAYRRASALRLEDTMVNFVQTKHLPDDYWTYEVGRWFDACLARLQEGILDFAIGPTDADYNNRTTLFADEETKKLCKNQLTRDVGNNTVNFSTLALIIIYSVGLGIVLLSLLVDQLSKFVYTKFWPQRSYKTKAWEEDGFLLLHRRAFTAGGNVGAEGDGDIEEDRKEISWTSNDVPVTTQRGKMAHFSLTSSTSHSRVSTMPQPVGDEDDSEDKEATRVDTVAVQESDDGREATQVATGAVQESDDRREATQVTTAVTPQGPDDDRREAAQVATDVTTQEPDDNSNNAHPRI